MVEISLPNFCISLGLEETDEEKNRDYFSVSSDLKDSKFTKLYPVMRIVVLT